MRLSKETTRRIALCALVGVVCVIDAGLVAADEAKIKVRARRGVGEYQPARGSGFFAWEQNTTERPGHFNAYAKRDGRKRFRLNKAGTQGALGGISGNLIVYQQFKGNWSNIRYYSIKRDKRFGPLIGINTRRWEYWPSISGDWVLFGRRSLDARKRKVILYNRALETSRVLDRTTNSDAFLAPGQVNGNFAVWYRCQADRRCNVYVYSIDLRLTRKIPNPHRRDQHSPSVTEDGVVYFVKGTKRCGVSARLMRHAEGDAARLLTLREGLDIGDTYAAADDAGNTEVYFEQNRCGTRAGSGIFKIVD